MTTQILDKIKLLPVSKQREVEDFVNFLVTKYFTPKKSLEINRRNLAGRLKGQINISEDFNDTPEDFKTYL